MRRFYMFAGHNKDRAFGMFTFVGDFETIRGAQDFLSFEDKNSIDNYDWAHIFDTKQKKIVFEADVKHGWQKANIPMHLIKNI